MKNEREEKNDGLAQIFLPCVVVGVRRILSQHP